MECIASQCNPVSFDWPHDLMIASLAALAHLYFFPFYILPSPRPMLANAEQFVINPQELHFLIPLSINNEETILMLVD
jgi:hypothetical protein